LSYSGYLALDEWTIAGGASLIGVSIYVLAMVMAYGARREVCRPYVQSWAFSALLLTLVAGLIVLFAGGFFNPAVWTLSGLAMLGIALMKSVLNMARSRQGVDRIRFRKNLAAAREYFRQELAKSNPRRRRGRRLVRMMLRPTPSRLIRLMIRLLIAA
jgi:uncharacterized membrane protein YbhN (UPF0104 family)